VDFDGSFVPATDDELMEVKDLLELEKSDMLSILDVVETVAHIAQDYFGIFVLAKMQNCRFSEIKLTKVDEENFRAQAEFRELRSLKADHYPSLVAEDSIPKSASSYKDRLVKESVNNGEESSSSPNDGLNKNGSSGSKPNFSLVKGEIDLDKLTTKELHETFRATFGRRTFVKDKMWLKRRIAMGLTNSCDVTVTSFIINDGKLMKKEELGNNLDSGNSVAGEV
uniref:Uncharacterized protein n=1 Tax=Chenopodium quinoa TaxID=63459 RepID=A0A803LVJ5_CHEQI